MTDNLDFGMKCIKYMLCVSNFMFVIIGILMIVIGSSVTQVYSEFELFLERHHFNPALLIISVGTIMCIVSLFGCIGAWRRSTFLVNFYTFLLCILFIMEISASIVAYVKRNSIEESIENEMRNSMWDYNKAEVATEGWDFVQDRLACCGVRKMEDWASHVINGTLITIENKTFAIPKSCCATAYCLYVFSSGCLDKVAYIISESAFMIATGGFCVALVQVLGVVFGNMLARNIRRIKTRDEMNRQNQHHIIYNLENQNYWLKTSSKA